MTGNYDLPFVINGGVRILGGILALLSVILFKWRQGAKADNCVEAHTGSAHVELESQPAEIGVSA